MAPEAGELRIAKPVYATVEAWARAAYPHEGCGLLIGRFQGGLKHADGFVTLKNVLLSRDGRSVDQSVSDSGGVITRERVAAGGGQTEFLMDPAEFDRATREAERSGRDVVGIVHTHPDHPPRPSPMDASQPMLAAWSNVIVAVAKGRDVEARSWVRPDDSAPFIEERLSIVEG